MSEVVEQSALDIHEVLQYLPHRYPFLLIDRVLSIEPGESIRALKNVSFNEPFFTGHFPGRPVMPGVLILEALAQAGGILAFKTTNSRPAPDSLYYFAGIDNARFKRVVEPGDQLILEVAVDKVKRDIWRFTAKASVAGQLACEATLMSAKRDI